MNIFSKKYWDKKREIDKKNLPFLFLSILLSFLLHLIIYKIDTIGVKIFFTKTFILAISIFGIFSFVFNLPHFNIKEDKSNEFSIKLILIIIPLILYFFYFK